MNIMKLLYSPDLLRNKIAWYFQSKQLKKVGSRSIVGRGFEILGAECISIGDNFVAGQRVKLHAWPIYKGTFLNVEPKLIIGNNVSITEGCYISCARMIIIGDGTLLGENVFITDNFHGKSTIKEMKVPPADRELFIKGSVNIGKNVWIGRNVCIMPNVFIGNGAVVGSNSVITHDVSAYSIVAGCPAHVIKTYSKG